MSRPSRARIVATIIAKDLRASARDRLFVFLTFLALFFYVLIFWLIPATVNESVTLGIVEGDLGPTLERAGEQQDEALRLVRFDSREELEGVISGDLKAWTMPDGELVVRARKSDEDKPEGGERLKLAVGLAFPADFVARTSTGQRSEVTLLADVQAPPELETAMKSFVRELAYALSGHDMPVTLPEEQSIVLGEDRAGRQVPFRDRMRPMLALFMLMVEGMALASLIASEISSRTVTAILSTPARASDLLLAKTILGTLLAAGQALVVLAAVGAFTASNWHVLLVAVLIGGFLFSGCAMLAGSAGKDFMGTLFLSMAFILPMAIPSFAVLFPGQAGPLVQALPSYGFIQVLLGVTAYAEPWSEQLVPLLGSLAWGVVIVGIGMLVLRRKVNTL